MAAAAGKGAVHVEGLGELVRAFRVANKAVARDVRTAIEQAGEPIRQQAQELVRSEISGMSRSRVPWWTIRLGIERSTIGYVVPQQRGVRYNRRTSTSNPNLRRKRPNLAELISEREERARDANSGRVEAEFVDALNEVARAWARV